MFLVGLLLAVSTATLASEVPRFSAPRDQLELNLLITGRIQNLKSAVQKKWQDDLSCESQPAKLKFIDCQNFPGGQETLSNHIRDGFQRGLSCLSQYSTVDDRKADLIALQEILATQEITFVCSDGIEKTVGFFREKKSDNGTDWEFERPPGSDIFGDYAAAASTTLGYPHWPTIAINVGLLKYKIENHLEIDLPQTLFHESYHWLNYRHKGFRSLLNDLVNDVSKCCFEQSEEACRSLERGEHDSSLFKNL